MYYYLLLKINFYVKELNMVGNGQHLVHHVQIRTEVGSQFQYEHPFQP